jgi:hypothetical protein
MTDAPKTTEDDRREWFRSVAWSDFISFAADEPGMREAFTANTGQPFGADTMEAFVLWVTRSHYGISEAPKAYRERYAHAA